MNHQTLTKAQNMAAHQITPGITHRTLLGSWRNLFQPKLFAHHLCNMEEDIMTYTTYMATQRLLLPTGYIFIEVWTQAYTCFHPVLYWVGENLCIIMYILYDVYIYSVCYYGVVLIECYVSYSKTNDHSSSVALRSLVKVFIVGTGPGITMLHGMI